MEHSIQNNTEEILSVDVLHLRDEVSTQHQQEKHQQEKHQQEKHQQEKHEQEKHQQEKHREQDDARDNLEARMMECLLKNL